MIEMLKRHEIQVLRRAGHTLTDIATRAGVSVRSVRRVETEPAVTVLDADAREHRAICRPSKAEPFRTFVMDVLAESQTCCRWSCSDARSSTATPVANARSTI